MSKSPARTSKSSSPSAARCSARSDGQPRCSPGLIARPRRFSRSPSLDLSNPEIWIIPKWEQAADLQLSAADLGYAVDALVDGAYATDYYSGGDKIDLRIVGEEQFAKSSQSLASLPIATPTGQLVPLEAIATIDDQERPGADQPPHAAAGHHAASHAAARNAARSGDGPDHDAGDRRRCRPAANCRAATASASRAPPTSSAPPGPRLKWNLALAVLITYLLMAATFESWIYPFVVIVTVPIGAVGGFIGLWLLNLYVLQPLDVLTMLGLHHARRHRGE